MLFNCKTKTWLPYICYIKEDCKWLFTLTSTG